jgi:hypothetical protein
MQAVLAVQAIYSQAFLQDLGVFSQVAHWFYQIAFLLIENQGWLRIDVPS